MGGVRGRGCGGGDRCVACCCEEENAEGLGLVGAGDRELERAARCPNQLALTMFVGDRITTHEIRAFRSASRTVVIPQDAILRDVRTSREPGCRFPAATSHLAVRTRACTFSSTGGDSLLHFTHGLIEATTNLESG